MEKTLDELKEEATELDIEFSDRIGAKTLSERIEAHYKKLDEETNGEVEVAETKEEAKPVETVSAVDKKSAEISELMKLEISEIKEKLKDDPKYMHMVISKKIGKRAKEGVVVKLTMVDKREASTATDAYFSNGAMAMRVPLDVYVEMPRALVEQVEAAVTRVHSVENGETRTKRAKKYVVDYKRD